MKEKLLPTNEAAKRLGVSRRTLYRMIERQEIQAKKITVKMYRIPASEVARILNNEYNPDTLQ